MRRPLLAALALLLTLGACGGLRDSRLNPFNWFGGSEARAARAEARAQAALPPTDPRPLVDQVTALTIEQVPGGAILRATGVPPTQGFWDAELVALEETPDASPEAGTGEAAEVSLAPRDVLVFEFRAALPPFIAREGTVPSREIEVATFLTDNDLNGIREIVVRGTRTERVLRR